MLSDPNRLRAIRLLARSDLCVCELADALQVTQSTLSNHLAKLRDVGLVSTRRDAAWVYYRLAPSVEGPIRDLLRLFDNQFQDYAQYREDDRRLQARLDMRIDGKCYRSYGQLA